jgi:hypothetical protein
MPVARWMNVDSAPARAVARGSGEPQGRGPPAVFDRGPRHPLKGWAGKDSALADFHSIQQPVVDVTRFGFEVGQVRQAALAAQVVRVVDHRLNPKRFPVFEAQLDPGILERRVHCHLGPPGDDPSPEPVVLAAGTPGEDQLDLLGPAEGEVVGHQRVEEQLG